MLSDDEVLKVLTDSPNKGLNKLMDQYIGFVYTIVHGKCSGVCGKEDIEECVSDIFYEIYKNRSFIDLEKGSIKSYIAIVAKRKAIDVFRKHQRAVRSQSIDEMEYEAFAVGDDTEKSVSDSETNAALIQEIKALGEPDSEIMIRKYYFGQSTKIIAKSLRIRENTVDKKVSRALQKLKIALGGAL